LNEQREKRLTIDEIRPSGASTRAAVKGR